MDIYIYIYIYTYYYIQDLESVKQNKELTCTQSDYPKECYFPTLPVCNKLVKLQEHTDLSDS